jgi:hypothetical protein
MAKFYESLNEDLTHFIEKQHIFFVASAPLSAEGHVNLSPKGHDCLRILSPNRAAYLDLTGSGNETSAHVRENGRLTFMFCAFDGPPRILRLFGKGHAVLPQDAEWDELSPLFPSILGTRQIMVIDIQVVQTSCGYAVPLYEYVALSSVGPRSKAMKGLRRIGVRKMYAAWMDCQRHWVSR